MKTIMFEQFHNLPSHKIEKLRRIAGGELKWRRTFRYVPLESKLEIGLIVFEMPVKNLYLEFYEHDGYQLPVIIAEPNDTQHKVEVSGCLYCGRDLRFRVNEVGMFEYFFSTPEGSTTWLGLRFDVQYVICNYCGKANTLPTRARWLLEGKL